MPTTTELLEFSHAVASLGIPDWAWVAIPLVPISLWLALDLSLYLRRTSPKRQG